MIEDSHLRCPFDGKRMLVEIGQDDSSGALEAVHFCLHCSYRERERPQLRLVPTRSAAERIRLQRLGEVRDVSA